jgi:hypothetical protein
MYLVAIAWIYVTLMMAVAEATNPQGTVIGAIVTFFLYGLGPMALVVYLMGTPLRRKAIRKREAAEHAARMNGSESEISGAEPAAAPMSDAPDGGGKAPADAVAPVRKES